ncbi:MAG: glycosyltransferase, partial [Planctomycetes bacterium]|nr:glycosyltransferase [Planctomycetota bacterium]
GALAAGCPVVALNAPGVRQIVAQRANGMLVDEESPEIFSNALRWVAGLTSDETAQMRRRARHSAEPYSVEEFVNQLLEVYGMTMDDNPGLVNLTGRDWEGLLKVMDREWRLWVNRLRAVARAATPRSFDE